MREDGFYEAAGENPENAAGESPAAHIGCGGAYGGNGNAQNGIGIFKVPAVNGKADSAEDILPAADAMAGLRQMVIAAYADDPRPCLIARRFGMHHSTVKRIIREAGIAAPDSQKGGCKNDEPDGGAAARAYIHVPEPEAAAHAFSGVDEKITAAQEAYLDALVLPSRIEKISAKDAAAVVKTLADVELRRSAQRAAERESRNSQAAGGGAAELSPGLKPWERAFDIIHGKNPGYFDGLDDEPE